MQLLALFSSHLKWYFLSYAIVCSGDNVNLHGIENNFIISTRTRRGTELFSAILDGAPKFFSKIGEGS